MAGDFDGGRTEEEEEEDNWYSRSLMTTEQTGFGPKISKSAPLGFQRVSHDSRNYNANPDPRWLAIGWAEQCKDYGTA
jgi:hypothetical protein